MPAMDRIVHRMLRRAPVRRFPFAIYYTLSVDLIEIRRSEEHTSELQSQSNLVCRLLLEKKKKTILTSFSTTITNNYIDIIPREKSIINKITIKSVTQYVNCIDSI